jgi:hypothetical protein
MIRNKEHNQTTIRKPAEKAKDLKPGFNYEPYGTLGKFRG